LIGENIDKFDEFLWVINIFPIMFFTLLPAVFFIAKICVGINICTVRFAKFLFFPGKIICHIVILQYN